MPREDVLVVDRFWDDIFSSSDMIYLYEDPMRARLCSSSGDSDCDRSWHVA